MTGERDADGWAVWDMTAAGTWPSLWPPVRYRPDGAMRMAIHADVPVKGGNLYGNVHGAFLAGLAEHVMGVFLEERGAAGVTVSLSLEYPVGARLGTALSGRVELVRETGRLQFLRVEIVQDDAVVVHGIATLRKIAAPAA